MEKHQVTQKNSTNLTYPKHYQKFYSFSLTCPESQNSIKKFITYRLIPLVTKEPRC